MNGWIIAIAVVGVFIILAALVALLCLFLTSGSSSTPATPAIQPTDARRTPNTGKPNTNVPGKKMPTKREEPTVPAAGEAVVETKNYIPDYYITPPPPTVPSALPRNSANASGNHSSNYDPTATRKEQNTGRSYTAPSNVYSNTSTGRTSSARGSYHSEQSSSFEPVHYEIRGRESNMGRRGGIMVGAGNVTPFSDEISVMSSMESDYPSSRSVDVMSPRDTIKK
jgi:hypothetical protein